MKQRRKYWKLFLVIFFLLGWALSAFWMFGFQIKSVAVYACTGSIVLEIPLKGKYFEAYDLLWFPVRASPDEVISFQEQWGLTLPYFMSDLSRQTNIFWLPLWMVLFIGAVAYVVGRNIRRVSKEKNSSRLAQKLGLISIWTVIASIVLPVNPTASSYVMPALTFVVFMFLLLAGILLVFRPLPRAGEGWLACFVVTMVFTMTRMLMIILQQVPLVWNFPALAGMLLMMVVIWGILMAMLLLYRFLHRRWSHVPYLGKCLKCAYDLQGNQSATCPECGTTIHEDQMRYLAHVATNEDDIAKANNHA